MEDGVAVLTLNRPERRTAMSGPMVEALARTLAALEIDDEVGCIVLTGTGGAFCAGGDVKGMAGEGVYVVLEGEGPVQSLRTSAHLASRNLGGILGRLLAFAFLMTFAYVVATIPASILGAVERTAEVTSAPIKIASVIWTSAVDTLFFPFWIAALMVLYRSLRPAAEIRSQAPVELGEEYRPASAVRAPFE